jgi:hypothetical protein
VILVLTQSNSLKKYAYDIIYWDCSSNVPIIGYAAELRLHIYMIFTYINTTQKMGKDRSVRTRNFLVRLSHWSVHWNASQQLGISLVDKSVSIIAYVDFSNKLSRR